MRKLNLDAIRRRVAAATPGTWKTGDRFGSGTLGSHVAVISGKLPPIELDVLRNGRNDAAFIAHAHQDIAALLDALDEAAGLRAELERIRSAGVDPRLLRWCSWPGCLASFDASTGPGGGGWMQYRHMAVLLCPDHKSTGHWPSYDMDRDDLTKLLTRCGCGATAEVRPSNWEAVFAWWEQHLADQGLVGPAS